MALHNGKWPDVIRTYGHAVSCDHAYTGDDTMLVRSGVALDSPICYDVKPVAIMLHLLPF